jgi:hypothetical protein
VGIWGRGEARGADRDGIEAAELELGSFLSGFDIAGEVVLSMSRGTLPFLDGRRTARGCLFFKVV